MTTPVACWVDIAGTRVDDGSTGESAVWAMSGLQVQWGRTTTVDQPDTSTASFDIADYTGDSTFAALCATGQVVDVYGNGTEWTGDPFQTLPDPSFDDPAAGNVEAAAGVTATVAGGVLTVNTGKTSNWKNGWVAKLPGVPNLLDPAAWDNVPRTALGQTWTINVGAAVVPTGMALGVGVVLLDSPADTVAKHVAAGQVSWTTWPTGTAYTRKYQPTVAGKWVAVVVAVNAAWTWDATAFGAAGLTWDTAPGTWDEAARFTVDDVTAWVPAAGAVRTVLVFSGRITDAVAVWDQNIGACVTTVTAADMSADLANRDVGATPWPVHTLAARVAAILTAAGVAGTTTTRIDPTIAGTLLTRMDVDRQSAYPMLADVATSVDGVLWPAGHVVTGPYLWFESLTSRRPVLALSMSGGVAVVVPDTSGMGVVVSACSLDLDPVTWAQTNADIATRAVVTWQDQTTTPDTTERTTQLVLADMEAQSNRFGVRRVSVQTQLTTAAAANAVADAVLTRLSRSGSWRVGGLRYTVPVLVGTDEVSTVLDLLDGTRRIGAPILITDLPAWSPAPADELAGYVEGGTYRFDDGAWVLELAVSNGDGIGAGARWDDMTAAYTWDSMGQLSWNDLAGVGAPISGG